MEVSIIKSDNPTADVRNMRRIIAEDPEWNLATVPTLHELCLSELINNFAFNSDVYHELNIRQKEVLLKRLPTTLPLKVTAMLISDEDYWCRCCKTRWAVANVALYGNSWKRMFFERALQGIIEHFIPGDTDRTQLNETIQLGKDYVKCLTIEEILPPIKNITPDKEDKNSDSDSDSDDEPLTDHIDFGRILDNLPYLVELRLMYVVKTCGMNFSWQLFQFTGKDCTELAKALHDHKILRRLHINKSRIDDDKCRVLISQLLDHPSLEVLDFSHNRIGDRGARALGKLLNGRSVLKTLNVANNCIRAAGGQALAHALIKNDKLTHLNLRLNRLMDDGGQALCKALIKNGRLTHLNLSANEMSEPTAVILSQVLKGNGVLVEMILSNNRLGQDGGKQIQEGIEDNQTILDIDLRFTECGQESEYFINNSLEKNKERKRLIEEINDPSKPENSRKFYEQQLKQLNG